MTPTQKHGKIFFIGALLLLAVMLFDPIVISFISNQLNLVSFLFNSILYVLVLTAAFRGGYLSLQIIQGCLGIFAAIFGIAVIAFGIKAATASSLDLPTVAWEQETMQGFPKAVSIIFVYWTLFFSKSVKEFITYQRAYFHLRGMRKIQESIGRDKVV